MFKISGITNMARKLHDYVLKDPSYDVLLGVDFSAQTKTIANHRVSCVQADEDTTCYENDKIKRHSTN